MKVGLDEWRLLDATVTDLQFDDDGDELVSITLTLDSGTEVDVELAA